MENVIEMMGPLDFGFFDKKLCTLEWYINNKLHRRNKPAYIQFGTDNWYIM